MVCNTSSDIESLKINVVCTLLFSALLIAILNSFPCTASVFTIGQFFWWWDLAPCQCTYVWCNDDLVATGCCQPGIVHITSITGSKCHHNAHGLMLVIKLLLEVCKAKINHCYQGTHYHCMWFQERRQSSLVNSDDQRWTVKVTLYHRIQTTLAISLLRNESCRNWCLGTCAIIFFWFENNPQYGISTINY